MGKKLLESERIIYVKPSEEFIEDYNIMYNDKSIQSLLFKKIYDEQQILKWINSFFSDDSIISLIERKTNKFIGNAALIKKENNIGEITISITPSMQGKHYATEAIQNLIKYAYDNLDFELIDLYVYKNNVKAIHIYKKINFVVDNNNISDDSIHMVHYR